MPTFIFGKFGFLKEKRTNPFLKRKKVSTFFKILQKSFGRNCGDIEHNLLYVVELLRKSQITDKFEKMYK